MLVLKNVAKFQAQSVNELVLLHATLVLVNYNRSFASPFLSPARHPLSKVMSNRLGESIYILIC